VNEAGLIELRPTQMVVGGDALARDGGGRVVFVQGAIPGETVRARIVTAKRDFAKAVVVEVVEASPDRVAPPCAAWHRGCGGCDWQHIDPSAQLGYKVSIVREALTRTAHLDDPVVRTAGSVDPWGYRTTVRLAPAGRSVGFRSRRSHDVVPIDECPIASPLINDVLRAGVSTPRGSELVLRASPATGAVNRSEGELWEEVAGVRLRVSIGSFFQSSPQAASLIVDAVARALHDVDLESAHVVDAYGGIGLFAACVAPTASKVTVVEESPAACADARVNLAHRPGVTIVESRVEDWRPAPADVVIADPARTGLGRAGADVVVATGAPVVVLVSCDTGSLGRDARLLGERGYRHDGTDVVDAFPNTSHIETISRFVRPAGGHS
jgi:23S rRNA (uracil1939-C5)-methyltransferase